MAFNVAAEAYDSFMGRYSAVLSPQFADFAGVGPGQDVLDVGCGPGALTAELVQRQAEVSAVDPSPQFVAAMRERYRMSMFARRARRSFRSKRRASTRRSRSSSSTSWRIRSAA
jgi:ubiquinone/menaquinone biosynthesis C-methylase UbiE